MRRILDLVDITPGDRPLTGGKAAELAALAALGLNVPPAFVVTTEAYSEAIARLSSPTVDQVRALDLPDALRADLGEALARVLPDADFVIVRSSASFEDSADFSAAGQLESLICPARLDDVIDTLKRCWAVLWREELLAYYRFAGGQGLPQIAMIVQELVQTDTAGVMFTQAPGAESGVLLVEAAWGMSSALTAGDVTPDHYLIDHATRQVINLKLPGGLPRRTLIDERGKVIVIDAPELTGRRTLDEAALGELAQAGLLIEAHYGTPQDIEWGYKDGRLVILQARPITAARSEDIFTSPDRHGSTFWTGGFFEERFPGAVSPLTWSFLFPVIEQTALRDPLRFVGAGDLDDLQILRLYRGHVYTNMVVFQMLYKWFPQFLLPADARRFFVEGNTRLRRQIKRPGVIAFVIAALHTFVTEPNWHPFNYRVWRFFVGRYRRRLNTLSADVTHPAEVIRTLETLRALTGDLLRIHRWSLIYAEVFSSILARLVRRWTSITPERVLTALLITEDSPTRRTDRALEQLRQQPVSQAALRQFLDEFGHRSFCLDLLCPRYADDPAQIWTTAALAGTTTDQPENERQRLAWELTRQLGGLWSPKTWIVRVVLFFARNYAALREDQRFEWQRALAMMRRTLTQAEARLIAAGHLQQPDDIFFLRWDEFTDLIMQRGDAPPAARVAGRRRDFRRVRYAPHPRFLHGDIPYQTPPSPHSGSVLTGVGASAGQAEGIARVIAHPDSLVDLLAQLGDGAILVTTATDPGWTPSFGRLRAVVMSVGGQLSHGAIVAREYGLPAVVAVENAVEIIKDGDRIRVDGDAGEVTILVRS